jgi:5'-3' exonuclease
MILIDFNGVAMPHVTAFNADLRTNDKERILDLCRHTILSQLLVYKKKYEQKYGEMVICLDGRNYWRKQEFPNYKSNRKKTKDEMVDWQIVYDCLNQIRDELKAFFPFKVIFVNEAEADDTMAFLVEWSQTNDLKEDLLYSEPKPMMVVSSDHDFSQLQKYDNVEQFSPFTKKLVKFNKKEIHEKRMEHIVKGDSGDGVPNLLSDDNVFVDKRRQSPMTQKRLAEFFEKGIDACKNDMERRNYQRNQMLVDFDFIPQRVKDKILEEYTNAKPVRDLNLIMEYFMKNKCRLLLETLQDWK